MNPYSDRLNEISNVLKQRMGETDTMIAGAMGCAEINFATQEEREELHGLFLKIQEWDTVNAAGAKQRIAERIRNRRAARA